MGLGKEQFKIFNTFRINFNVILKDLNTLKTNFITILKILFHSIHSDYIESNFSEF